MLFYYWQPSVCKAATTPHVDPALCQALVNYTPDPDVEYNPGVDVDGHYVAPADMLVAPKPPAEGGPKKINIPLTISLAKALNFDTTQYPYNQLGTGTEAQLGVISVEGNKVTLNGKALSGQQQDQLATLCNKQKTE